MTLRVLLVESEPEELLFLQDVLREIEEERLLPEWSRVEATCAVTWSEARRIFSTSPPHVILLDLEAGGEALEQFRSVQASVPEVPVILLMETGDEDQAARLLKEGAQDFLAKTEVDCVPLAHSLRNAVSRHKLLTAARASALTDPLTGLSNRPGFLGVAARDRKLAERLGRRWMLLVAEPRNLGQIAAAFGEQRRDLELIKAAEQLRAIATPADWVGRLSDRHFALSIFDSDIESAEEAWARIRTAAAEAHIDIGASIFDVSRPLTLDAMLDQALEDLPRPQTSGQPRVAGAA